MVIFIKNFNNALKYVFFAVFIIILLTISGFDVNAASPVVRKAILNQTVHNGQTFHMSIPTYDIFADSDGDSLTMTVKQANGSDLPIWLKVENKPIAPILVGSLGTGSRAWHVCVVGNHAYVAAHTAGLKIIDISSPSMPKLVGSLDTSGESRGITVVGNYAYIADSADGLKIVNISNPSNSTLAGSFDTSYAAGVAISGNYAYVADGSSGLKVINVINPSNPTLTDSLNTGTTAYSVTVKGNYAYVASYVGNDLKIVDISNPSNSIVVGSLDTSKQAYDVAVSKNYAYLANYYDGLTVVNVSTVSNPTVVGTLDTAGATEGIKVFGNYAYLSDSNALRIVNITAPSNPVLVTSLDPQSPDEQLDVFGDYAYLATDAGLAIIGNVGEGLQLRGFPESGDVGTLNLKVTASDGANEVSTTFLIDVQNASPTVVNTIPNQVAYNGKPFNMTIKTYKTFKDPDGNSLNFTVKQSDDSDLPAWLTIENQNIFPSLTGSLDVTNFCHGLAIANDCAYLADWPTGLKIVNITNPSNMSLIGSLATTGSARGVTVEGSYAYVADWDEGLKAVNVTIPSNPVLIGSVDTTGNARKVKVAENYAYVPDSDAGLQIINIADPTNPSIVKTLNTSGSAYDVCVVGNYAYVADFSGGLKIIDITIPAAAFQVGSLNTDGNAFEVVVVGKYAYVAIWDKGLQIIDISNPYNPVSVASLDTTGYAVGISAQGNHVYIADDTQGLKIIDIHDPSSPTLVNSLSTMDATDVTIIGDYAYVANGDSGFKIISDVSESFFLSGTPFISDAKILNLKVIANDGVDSVSIPFSINVVCPSVQEAPIVSNILKSGSEDAVLSFNAQDFINHFIDVNCDSLTKIQITSLPTNGVLKLSEMPVILDQEIDAGDLGNLTFEPDENWYGVTSFSWKGYDGSDYSVASANVNITISSVNDIPVLSELSKSGSEDKTVIFSAEDFIDHFSDVEGDNLIKIQIMSLPTNGVLKLLETPVTLDQEIDVGDLNNLVFEPKKNWYGKTSFDWRGYDGVDYSEAVSAEIFIDEVAEKKPKDNTVADWMIWSAAGAVGAVAATTAIITTAIIVMKKKGLACFGKSNADIELKDRKEFDRVELYTSWSADGDDGKDV